MSPDRPGYWRIKEATYQELQAKAGRRKHDFALAANLWRRSFSQGARQGSSVAIKRILEFIRLPALAHAELALTLTELRSGSIHSWADFSAVWNAHQRAVVELESFTNFCALVLPSADDRDRLDRCLRHSHLPRRGIILSPSDMDDFFEFFRMLRVPVYALASPDMLIGSAQPVQARSTRPAWYSTTSSPRCGKHAIIQSRSILIVSRQAQ